MNAKPKKKLCWNCEGATSFEEANCSYCGVYLHPLSISDSEEDDIFNPPYKIQPNNKEEIPESPFNVNKQESVEIEQNEMVAEESVSVLSSGLKETLVPLMLLSFGSIFSVFALVLMLFSQNGIFSLQWNADNWYLYLVVSLPMLFFGWHTLQRLNDE